MYTENCEIYITDSSAKMLSKEIASYMRGRTLSWEIFPFSFKEYLDYKKIKISKTFSTKKELIIRKAFDKYWEKGGFPEVAGVKRSLKIKIHQEYFQTILFRDLIDRYNISHPKAIKDLAYQLIDNTASLYTINSLFGFLHSLRYKVPKSSVSNYLEWFEDAFLLFTVRLFDASFSRSNANTKKFIVLIIHLLLLFLLEFL